MTLNNTKSSSGNDGAPVLASALLRLDLATEVLEGLDELGVETKAHLLTLMDELERQIAEED